MAACALRRAVLCFIACALTLAASGILTTFASAQPLTLVVASVEAGRDQRTRKPIVSITLTEASKALLTAFTSENIGRKVEIRSGGVVLMTPVIRQPIFNGFFQVSGTFTDRETADIVKRVKINSRLNIDVME